MQDFLIEDHEHSILPDGNWQLVWHDEFDGTELDRTKWDYRLSMMGKRHPAWTDKAVHLDGNSNAVFEVINENGKPVSSQLQTGYNFMDEPPQKMTFGNSNLQWNIGKLKKPLFTHTYGYYECRCKLPQMPDDRWWGAFWLQSPIIGASLDPAESGAEIDIMECFDHGKIAAHTVYTGGYGKDMQHSNTGGHYPNSNPDACKLPEVDMAQFHRFGVLGDETGYTFYIDGQEDGRVSKHISKRPQFILISTEVKGYRVGDHQPFPEAYELIGKDCFIVDYVRVFDRVK